MGTTDAWSIARALTAPIVVCTFMGSFLLLDCYLYFTVISMPEGTTLPIIMNTTNNGPYCTSPFCVINVKTLMKGPPNFYIHHSICMQLVKHLDMANSLLYITPNQITILDAVVALVASYCIANDSLRMRRIGVFLFQLRNLMDELDGAVARIRKEPLTLTNYSTGGIEPTSITSHIGYWFDGIADAFGILFLHVACLSYLKRHNFRKNFSYQPLPLMSPTRNGCSSSSSSHNQDSKGKGRLLGSRHSSHLTRELVRFLNRPSMLPVMFGVQMMIGCIYWNKFILQYTDFLERGPGIQQSLEDVEFKAVLLKSPWIWVVFLLWRYSNPFMFLEFLLMAIFLDKMGELLYLFRIFGFVCMFLSIGVTKVHSCLMQMHYFV